jgi:hypothetical protein
MALSFAISLIGGGASALMAHGEAASFVFCAALFVPVLIDAVGLAIALEEDWYHAVLALIPLPGLFFLWAVGLGAIRELHPHVGYLCVALGLGLLALAARPGSHTHVLPTRFAAQH